MSKNKNSFIDFFASVKLALFVLFFLAVSSIIGTVIPQKKPPEAYIELYGDNMAKLFQVLDIPDMYNSWWFILLLGLLCLNLIVCTIKRLPNVWRMVTLDNLTTDLSRLGKMKERKTYHPSSSINEAASQVKNSMTSCGWKSSETEREGGILLFAQTGPWSRLGVYVVHASIIVIFIGAMIGSYFGYKGSMMIPETTSKDTIFEFGTGKPLKLDFSILCERFILTRYDTGAPKEFLSDLVVLEQGKEVLRRSIEVNDPLHYKGHTFYQSSYEPYNKFLVTLTNNNTAQSERFLAEPGKEVKWKMGQSDITYGIINRQATNEPGVLNYKIWFDDESGEPSTFWILDGGSVSVPRGDTDYTFTLKEFFATGLQVTKDPGVWYVYIGCILMLLGLTAAFFVSHRRIWVFISNEDGKSKVLVSGTSNKNSLAFEKTFEKLTNKIDSDLSA